MEGVNRGGQLRKSKAARTKSHPLSKSKIIAYIAWSTTCSLWTAGILNSEPIRFNDLRTAREVPFGPPDSSLIKVQSRGIDRIIVSTTAKRAWRTS
jgi:hypothetical protein